MASSEESELERLDARANIVARDFSDDDDDDDYSKGSSELSESDSDEHHDVTAAAAVVPQKRSKTPRTTEAPQSKLLEHPEDRNLEEDDGVLRATSWRDLEDTRRFLENDHRERFDVLISRWEGVDDGDDIDLNTGRVVVSKGHLDALAPQKNLAFFDDTDEDDEDEQNDPGDELGDVKADFDAGIDPLYIVCQKPSPLLDMVVTSMYETW